MAMTNSITKTGSQIIARPLKVLVPLMHEDLRLAREAENVAGMPYYRAFGEKLLEARPQHDSYRSFIDWGERQFNLKRRTLDTYMNLAESVEKGSALPYKTLGDFIRKTSTSESGAKYNTFESKKPAWEPEVKRIAASVDYDALRRDDLKRAEEREQERKLGLKLIDIGYKVLAQQMHPDKKGGSNEYFARLKNVRDRLNNHV